MSIHDPSTLLDRYLAGEVAEEEQAGALAQLEGADADLLRVLPDVFGTEAVPGKEEYDSGLQTLKSAMQQTELDRTIAKPRKGALSSNGWLKAGSVLCAFAAVIIVSAVYLRGNDGTKIDTSNIKTYTTLPGQRASLTLSDGSQVTLGPVTTLRVQNSGAATSVEVIGEALFNVRHAAQRSFIVKAHGVTTRVLGTEFVVRAYDTSNIRVAVRDGRVSVQGPLLTSADAAIVNSGEAASITPNSLPVVTPISDLAADFAWANGDLVLRNVPLGEALTRLSNWYGLEFRVTDSSLFKENIGATFPSSFNQRDVDALARSIKAVATRSGNTITFSRIP